VPRPEPVASMEIEIIERRLDAVRRRLWLREVLRATAIAALAASVLYLVARRGLTVQDAAVTSGAVSCVAAITWLLARPQRWSRFIAARALEAARPASRNLIVTAEELLRHPERAHPTVLARVFRQTAEVIGSSTSEAVPLQRDLLAAVAALMLGTAMALGVPQSAAVALRDRVQQTFDRSQSRDTPVVVQAIVTPPEYTGQPPIRVEAPERIEAVQGSRLQLTLRRGRDVRGWRARFGTKPMQFEGSVDEPRIAMTLVESGYIAIELVDPNAAERRLLLPVAVSPDRAPTITIESPGKDLLLPDAKATIAVAGTAADDYGIQTLDLRYTKVSGSGEQFEFNEGSIPLSVSRDTVRSWKARAEIVLTALALAPGDALIYRIVGRDRRPGDAGLASSETFFIEVAGPGQVALAGVELPPDRERYALSQQMIVLKLERLKDRLPTSDRLSVKADMATLAAEQRAVRANFVFLTGGHVEDEEQEAEHSHEIQEGRLENTARREIVAAIQHMGRAEQGMAMVSVDAALPPARAAVEALQRAFGRNRYFLRTLPVRSRVDASRRLTGELSAAADWRRELFADAGNPGSAEARTLLARVLALSHDIRAGSAAPAALTALAEQAVAIDPSSQAWQDVSRDLLALGDRRDTSPADRTKRLNTVTFAIAAETMRQATTLHSAERADEGLRSAWQQEKRRP
jgi:hypothetical protein